MVAGAADAAGNTVKLAPEMPEVPPMPATYNGPTLAEKTVTGADLKNMF